jgi:hypothetical protein
VDVREKSDFPLKKLKTEDGFFKMKKKLMANLQEKKYYKILN